MRDIYGPERDWGDVCDEAYDRRKQDELERAAYARLDAEKTVTHYVNDSATPEWLQAAASMDASDDANARQPGRIVAEFDCGRDALQYAKAKGPGYTVTPGIHHLFAVRELV